MGAVGRESPQSDSKYYPKVSFKMNILVCGNYKQEKLERKLKEIKIIDDKNIKYFKKGSHKTISEWDYYFFKKDKEVGKKTFRFIEDSILNNENKNLILFYSGIKDFTAKDLLIFYDGINSNYFDKYH